MNGAFNDLTPGLFLNVLYLLPACLRDSSHGYYTLSYLLSLLSARYE